MISHLIKRIRLEQKLSKNKLGKMCSMDLSYITHLEKGDRYPSIDACKKLSKAFNIPEATLLTSYGKKLNYDQKLRDMQKYICTDKILAINNIDGLISCPPDALNANFAILINDTSMEPTLKKGEYAYIDLNTPMDSKDIGLFEYNGKFLLRQLSFGIRIISLIPLNPQFEKITINKDDSFSILGKVIATKKISK